MLNTIDLFAGCGGMTLGFQNAGFKIVAAYDNWDAALTVYRLNFDNHNIFKTDLSSLTDIEEHLILSDPEIIIGGPPCQDFSSAGKRDESLGRADLTATFAQIVSIIRPKYFVMENVERIKKSHTIKKVIEIFRDADYGLTETVLTASLCGVPQKRKRYFLIGEYNGRDCFLNYYLDKYLSSRHMTIRDYFKDSLGIDFYYRHPRSYKRRAIFSIDEPSPTIRGVNRPIPAGYKQHSGDRAPLSDNLRPLTTVERSLIQTFPNNFVWSGSKSDLEQMIGNAVPVKLAEYVASCLMKYILNRKDDRRIHEREKILHNEIS